MAILIHATSGYTYSNPNLQTEGLFPHEISHAVASVNHPPQSFSSTVREGEQNSAALTQLTVCLVLVCLIEPFLKASQIFIPKNILYQWGQESQRC